MGSGQISWEWVEDSCFKILQRRDSTSVSLGHVYRMIQEAARNGCRGWSKLRTNRQIYWWQYDDLTVFVCFEFHRLIVLALVEGRRPADFDQGQQDAETVFRKLQRNGNGK
jgi:hypothetical protein